jgi:putative Mn2+ efflux pump MntP
MGAGRVLVGDTFSRKLFFISVMFLMQSILAGAGLWIGFKMGSLAAQINMAISLSILLIFGLKVLFAGIKTQAEEKSYDYSNNNVVFFASMAEGITPLSIGIAIGLLTMKPYLHWAIIAGFLLTGIMTGMVSGLSMGEKLNKLRPGPIGGLLLIAAAIKLLVNLVGF